MDLEKNMSATDGKFIIGLTGSLGSGCSTLSKALTSHGFTRVSISDQIKKKFKELNPDKEPTFESFGEDWRAELQDIGNSGRKGEFVHDKKPDQDYRDYWVDLALKDTQSACIVIDGIRNVGEIELLRNEYPNFRVVAVYADYETRWSRVKGGNYPTEGTFERDDMRDSDEEDACGQSVQRCVYEADYVLKNTDDIQPPRTIGEVLSKKLMQDVRGMKGEKDFRKPFAAEVFMATAVSQSHASQCLKRKVGALIVDDVNKIPLSVGYNDNPIGMESCFSLYNGICYKDRAMETKLEQMVPFFCPDCGKQHDELRPPWRCNKDNNGKPCRCNFKGRFFPSRNIELCTAIHAEERAIRSLGGPQCGRLYFICQYFPVFSMLQIH
jgi:deoxycytidylate deaminase